jgi:hypothetical protein
MGRRIHGRHAAAMPWQERNTHVKISPGQIPGEICERLRRITETVQEQDRPRVAGAQVDWACAWNNVCYESSIGM